MNRETFQGNDLAITARKGYTSVSESPLSCGNRKPAGWHWTVDSLLEEEWHQEGEGSYSLSQWLALVHPQPMHTKVQFLETGTVTLQLQDLNIRRCLVFAFKERYKSLQKYIVLNHLLFLG
jgi:hypothetical protein